MGRQSGVGKHPKSILSSFQACQLLGQALNGRTSLACPRPHLVAFDIMTEPPAAMALSAAAKSRAYVAMDADFARVLTLIDDPLSLAGTVLVIGFLLTRLAFRKSSIGHLLCQLASFAGFTGMLTAAKVSPFAPTPVMGITIAYLTISPGSTGRRNGHVDQSQVLIKRLGRRLPVKGLARPAVESQRHRLESIPAVTAQVSALRKILAY